MMYSFNLTAHAKIRAKTVVEQIKKDDLCRFLFFLKHQKLHSTSKMIHIIQVACLSVNLS